MSTQTMTTQGINLTGAKYASNLGNTRNVSESGNFNEYLNNNLKPNVPDKENNVEMKARPVEKATDTKASSFTEKNKNVNQLKETKKTQGINNSSDTNDLSNKVSKLSEKIKSIVKDSLNLDDEELSQLMNQFGFTMLDLLNPENLKILCMGASGETDVGVLLINEDLSNRLSTLLQDMKEVSIEDFGITDEELKYLLDKSVASAKAETDKSQLVSDKQSSNSVSIEILENENTVPTQGGITSNTQNQTDKNVKVMVEKEASMNDLKANQVVVDPEQSSNSESNGNLQQDTSRQADIGLHNENNQQKNIDASTDANVDQIINNLTFTTIQNVDGANQQIVEVTQMRDIVNQIVKEIRIQIKPDTTSMDLSLNPDNLGKVNLSVVVKDGNLTARFMVESSAAKEAIESQLQLLKDNLNNQGVKVEAIEVTVSNFSFAESNEMSQSGKEQKQNQRKIKFDSLEELNDVTNDSDIISQMMLTNGNTVDYTA